MIKSQIIWFENKHFKSIVLETKILANCQNAK